MPFETTFIGQQSWLIEVAGARFLVDPVLDDSFGHSPHLRFEIFPAREVHTDLLPDIDAVIVTNEHLDHFYLPSLRRIPPDVPILMPELMPAVCVQALRELGREVRLLRPEEETHIGGAGVVMFRGARDVPVWESRVASVCIRPAGSDGGVFVQSDTALDDRPETFGCRPEMFIVTHNAQIPPAGQLGAFGNLLPIPEETPPEVTGVAILHELLNEVASRFGSVRWVAFSGGGYTQVPSKHGEFLWADFKELERLTTGLSLDTRVVGLTPGETCRVTGSQLCRENAKWISPRLSSIPVAKADRNANAEYDVGDDLLPLFPGSPTDADRELITAELAKMAPVFMLSPLGRALVYQNVYLDQPTGPCRFAIHLRGLGDDRSVLALNVNNGRFEWFEGGLKDAVFGVPAGIDVNAVDLAAVFRGEIHIWELAVSRLRQWFLCSPVESPVAFLYGYLSEQIRPDLAARMYRRLLDR